jgi:hypothetical protein
MLMTGSFLFDPQVGAMYRWHESNLSHSWYAKRRVAAAEFRYTIRALANTAYRCGLITKEQIMNETLTWPARDVSTLVTALAAPEANPALQRAAVYIFHQRKDIRKNGASGHTRLAGIVGSWYLKFADKLDRFIAQWPPRE